LFRVYLANTIGELSLGIYQIGFSVFLVLNAIITSGFPLVVSKLTTKYRLEKQHNKEHSIVSASIVLGLAISTIIFVLMLVTKPLLVNLLSGEKAYYVLLTLVPSLFAISIFSAFKGSLWGQEKHFTLSLIDLIEEVIKMLVTIFLIEFAINIFAGEVSASLSVTVSCFVSSILTMRYYFKYEGKFKKPTKQHYKLLLKHSLPITGMRVTASLIQPLIAILIPIRLVASGFTKEQALSQLGVALGMTFPLLFLPLTVVGALSVTLIPSLTSALQKNNKDDLKHQINSALQFTIFTSFLFIPVYIGIGIPITKFLFSNVTSGVYLMQGAFLMLPISLANITSSILNALNLEVKSFKNYILGSMLLILSLWFLPPFIEVRALIYGMALCMASVSVLNLRMIIKATNTKFKIIKPIFYMSLFLIPSSLLCSYSYTLFNTFFPNILALLFSASFGIVAFGVLCIVFGFLQIDFWVSKFKNILNKKKQKPTIA